MKILIRVVVFAMAALAAGIQMYAQDNRFVQTILVANDAAFKPRMVDETMVNAWGIAVRPPGAGGHFWINNAKTGNSVEYIGDVEGVPLRQDGLKSVTLDTPRFTDHGYASVTGLAYNAASDIPGQPVEFPVSGPAINYSTNPPQPITAGTSGSAKFVFVTEDGAINAWRLNTAASMTSAPVIIDYSKTANYPYNANCVFSGTAMTANAYNTPAYTRAGGNLLFATDFRNNVIEVFNNQWKDITSSFHFQTSSAVGELHVYNITDIAGHLYVAYAMFNPDGDEGMEEKDGPGYGHVVEYNEDGTLVKDFNDQDKLNSPWGMAIAPPGFGNFGGDLLVSNFGDGTIAAFDPATGDFVDYLRDESGDAIRIDGIWGLVFGNGVSLGDANSLYFTAGPNSESAGEFGKLTVVPHHP